jgi:hypothetical protein
VDIVSTEVSDKNITSIIRMRSFSDLETTFTATGDRKREDRRFWTEWKQALPELNVILI